jgi:transposase
MEKHEWIKAHIMCGVTTNIVTSVEITDAYGADSPQFIPLVEVTARTFDIEQVSADKAYSARVNLAAVTTFGGTPYIPFRIDARARSRDATLWDQLYHFYHLHRETFLQHYHRRSLVESTFSMMKAKFGDALRSKTDTALVNELLCKVLCHNICVLIQSMYELGVPICFES